MMTYRSDETGRRRLPRHLLLVALCMSAVIGIRPAPSAMAVQQQARDPGQVIEARRTHARMLRGPEPRRIPQALAQRTGDIILTDSAGPTVFDVTGASSRIEEELAGYLCFADAAVVGTLVDSQARLTVDESWLFSELKFQVETVFKDRTGQLGETIDTVMEGGQTIIDGRRVVALNSNFSPLPLPGRRYLLFLWLLKETGTFKVGGGVALRPAEATVAGNDRRGMRSMNEAGLLQAVSALIDRWRTAVKDSCGVGR